MSNRPNDLVALEWLMPPLNEEFHAIYAIWQTNDDGSCFSELAKHFHTLTGVLTVANLNVFAEVSNAIRMLNESYHTSEAHADASVPTALTIDRINGETLYAMKLLRHELGRYIHTGGNQLMLMQLRLGYLDQLLGGTGTPTLTTAEQARFSERLTKLSIEPLLLSVANYEKLKMAWKYSTDQLLSHNQNALDALSNLKKVTDYLKQGATNHALQSLWHITGLWFDNLMVNDEPKPADYRFVLSQLARAIDIQHHKQYDDIHETLWLENLLINLYVELGELSTVSEEVHALLSGLSHSIASEQAFFPHVLGVLEGVLFALANGQLDSGVLEVVAERFAERGWSFYADRTQAILDDIRDNRDDPEMWAQAQWQISTKVQDLYTSVLATHQAIDKKEQQASELVGVSEQSTDDAFIKVQSLLEHYKATLSDYISHKDPSVLPSAKSLTSLDTAFNDIGMTTVGDATRALGTLFAELKELAPTKLSWQLVHEAVDSLSMFELFLNGLAEQVFDHALLARAQEGFVKAQALLGESVDEASEYHDLTQSAHQDDGVVRYDDSGEIMPDIKTGDEPDGVPTLPNDDVTQRAQDDAQDPDIALEDTVPEDVVAEKGNQELLADHKARSSEVFVSIEQTTDTELHLSQAQDDIEHIERIESCAKSSEGDTKSAEGDSEQTSDDTDVLFGDADDEVDDIDDIDDSIDNAVLDADDVHDADGAHVAESAMLLDAQSGADMLGSDAYQAILFELPKDALGDLDEINEIFVEEVDEVCTTMADLLPVWQALPQDLDTAYEIRRGFHTLKGSGRMVGAHQLGEAAWAVEHLMNRMLDGGMTPSRQIADFVADVAGKMPVMVSDFQLQRSNSAAVARIVLQARNLLDGKDIDEGVPKIDAKIVPDLDSTIFEYHSAQSNQLAHDDAYDDQADDKHQISLDDAQTLIADDELVDNIADESAYGLDRTDNEFGELADEPEHAVGARAEYPAVLVPFLDMVAQSLSEDNQDVDADIKEIFIEEAREVLTEITPLYDAWLASNDKVADQQMLIDVRRGFHTLKGSGRMVGAVSLGELAWSVENMLNRVLDATVVMTDGMELLVASVLDDFDGLVTCFESGQAYPERLSLQTACAHAYSKGNGQAFDYAKLIGIPQSAPSAETAATKEQSVPVDSDASDQDNIRELQTLASIQSAGEKLAQATVSAPSTEEEELLCGFFVEEARELLADIQAYLDHQQEPSQVPNEIVRAFHTLRGASGLPPLKAVSDVSAIIEKNLQILQQHETPLTDKHHQALVGAVTLIHDLLDKYEGRVHGSEFTQDQLEEDKSQLECLFADGAPKGRFEVASLVDGIDDLLDAELELEKVALGDSNDVRTYAVTLITQIHALKEKTTASAKFQRTLSTLDYAYHLLANAPKQATDDALIDKILAVHGQLTALFDAIASSMALTINDDVLLALTTKVDDVASLYDIMLKEVDALDEITEPQVVVDPYANLGVEIYASSRPVQYEAIGTDPELLGIFLEETGELDGAIHQALQAWRADITDQDSLKLIVRHLDTIKGGAKLVDIIGVSELAQETRDVYEWFLARELTASLGWVEIMQGVHDTLSLQLSEIKEHGHCFYANDVIDQLLELVEKGHIPKGTRFALPFLRQDERYADAEHSVNTERDDEVVTPAWDAKLYERQRLASWHGEMPDSDLLEIFLSEFEELAQVSDSDFAAFSSNTGDINALQSLQRYLHTIKGGARMVSANGIADLAHNMETVYEDFVNRRSPTTAPVIGLLSNCHRWINEAVELLKLQYNPPAPSRLIDALADFTKDPDSIGDVEPISLSSYIDAAHAYELSEKNRLGIRDITVMPKMLGNFADSNEHANANEMIRVSTGLMEQMINLSGEAAINRARVDANLTSLTDTIKEMGDTVQRLFDQLRRMDIELEAQILAQLDEEVRNDYGDFDPLEMDRYSSLNQLSKSLSESASDLLDLKATLLDKTRDGENLLVQLSRTQSELQTGLMNSRMVPFSRLVPRMQRIARQTADELGKRVELSIINADDEMDRTVLERIAAPLEHMMRNAIDHGIELPEVREAYAKNPTGRVVLGFEREGSEIVIHLTDDGAGINVDAVRKKAIAQGLIDANDDTLSKLDIMQYIFNAGLSTTTKVTQISGRGVGMDVVRSEIRALGGSVSVESEPGKGSRFTIRVPLTVAVADTLVVRAADRHYAIPLVQIERVTQVSPKALLDYYQSSRGTFDIEGTPYRLRYLNEILSGHDFGELLSADTGLPVIIIKNQAGQNLAIQVDEIIGSRIEVAIKPLGKQLSYVSGISAATIMGDGSVMLILDLLALMRNAQARVAAVLEAKSDSTRPTILVVDDSVTVRKVTSRFLERQGFEAVVAKDGVDALEILQEMTPDLMLLDIEMPRLDGFEVATQVRHNTRLQNLPIIMITSRTGEKHKERAYEIGVNGYMGKPFQETQLLTLIEELLEKP